MKQMPDEMQAGKSPIKIANKLLKAACESLGVRNIRRMLIYSQSHLHTPHKVFIRKTGGTKTIRNPLLLMGQDYSECNALETQGTDPCLTLRLKQNNRECYFLSYTTRLVSIKQQIKQSTSKEVPDSKKIPSLLLRSK